MSDRDERRIADLLRSGLSQGEPPEQLWEVSRGRYRRVRAQRRAAGALAAVVAVLAVGLVIPRLVPGPPQQRLVLDAPSVLEPGATPTAPSPPAPGPTVTPTPSPSPSTPSSLPATATPSRAACSSSDLADGAQLRQVDDIDGDGAPDSVALAGGALQLVTADGLVTAPLEVGEQPARAVGVADLDGDGVGDLFVRTSGRAGERVTIARFDGCAITFVLNAEGEPYAFDVGDRADALVGMGCVDTDDDGDLELVGLAGRLDGDAYAVERTVVDIRGARARNGAIDTVRVPADDARVELIYSATCGERLLDDAEFG